MFNVTLAIYCAEYNWAALTTFIVSMFEIHVHCLKCTVKVPVVSCIEIKNMYIPNKVGFDTFCKV